MLEIWKNKSSGIVKFIDKYTNPLKNKANCNGFYKKTHPKSIVNACKQLKCLKIAQIAIYMHFCMDLKNGENMKKNPLQKKMRSLQNSLAQRRAHPFNRFLYLKYFKDFQDDQARITITVSIYTRNVVCHHHGISSSKKILY